MPIRLQKKKDVKNEKNADDIQNSMRVIIIYLFKFFFHIRLYQKSVSYFFKFEILQKEFPFHCFLFLPRSRCIFSYLYKFLLNCFSLKLIGIFL